MNVSEGKYEERIKMERGRGRVIGIKQKLRESEGNKVGKRGKGREEDKHK